ncbi:hypothetical protein IE077_001248 [Cardiosporidium cionae]|uniref:Hflx-type G domain-containing protein n=1 Tax=Cardiosporidium cionae TaxID=476202 RepID=A0ABQ7J467_9APIC|nr:hypothetical protein IE077_001248 [Cardiosporidium cionae]|eukprot:KAF8817795.1 hypothetical protein IE077_001248 [Cardiosporidium cionae]
MSFLLLCLLKERFGMCQPVMRTSETIFNLPNILQGRFPSLLFSSKIDSIRLIMRLMHHEKHESPLLHGLYESNPLVMTIHPLEKKKSWQEFLWDAEEALGLVRAAKWDALPGPTIPRGGWKEEELAEVHHLKQLRMDKQLQFPSEWKLIRSDEESDEEYDETWHSLPLRQQWAESCIVRVRSRDQNYFFGKGKLEQILNVFSQQPAHYVFINTFLSAKQHGNLENFFNNSLIVKKHSLKCGDFSEQAEFDCVENLSHSQLPSRVEVIDRYRIILEIFSQRAKSKEAKLQIDLARTMFIRSRVLYNTISWKTQQESLQNRRLRLPSTFKSQECSFTSQFIKSSETFTEYHRRLLDDILKDIREGLAELQKNRKIHRKGRESTVTIAFVGYTNAGKTALANQLSGSNLKIDSVGFIQDLPYSFFEAFQATLEEILEADILIHVRDVSHPQMELQNSVVLRALDSVGWNQQREHLQLIEVWNKIDLLPSDKLNKLLDVMPRHAIPICANSGLGCDILLEALEKMIRSLKRHLTYPISFPTEQAPQRLQFLSRHCGLIRETLRVSSTGDTTTVDVRCSSHELRKYIREFEESPRF